MKFYLAVSDVGLEELEMLVISVLAVLAVWFGLYIKRLRDEVRRHKDELDEQQNLNQKLNQVVDRVLKIDADGTIDSERKDHTKK